MAEYAVNRKAVAHAQRLIRARQYVLDSDWGEVQPRADDENAFLRSHSWADYALWHVGLTEDATDETKARYAFVIGDSGGCIGPGSSPATIGRPNGGTRRSSSRRIGSCSSSTGRAV